MPATRAPTTRAESSSEDSDGDEDGGAGARSRPTDDCAARSNRRPRARCASYSARATRRARQLLLDEPAPLALVAAEPTVLAVLARGAFEAAIGEPSLVEAADDSEAHDESEAGGASDTGDDDEASFNYGGRLEPRLDPAAARAVARAGRAPLGVGASVPCRVVALAALLLQSRARPSATLLGGKLRTAASRTSARRRRGEPLPRLGTRYSRRGTRISGGATAAARGSTW